MSISTTRGCYNSCSFCGASEFYEICKVPKVRYRSVENVVNELKYIVEEFNPKTIKIVDEIFISPGNKRKEWISNFCSAIKEIGLKVSFHCQAKASDIINNQKALVALRKVGLEHIFIGIESFNQRQLDYFNKRTTTEENVLAVQILRDLSIPIQMGFMLLDHYSTVKEVHSNLITLRNADVIEAFHYGQKLFSNYIMIAIPGTKVYKDLMDKQLIRNTPMCYDFADENTSVFYNHMKEWNAKARKLDDFLFLAIARDIWTEQKGESAQLMSFKRRLLRLDLDFLIALSRDIDQGKLNSLHKLLDEYDAVLHALQLESGCLEKETFVGQL